MIILGVDLEKEMACIAHVSERLPDGVLSFRTLP